MICEMYLTGVKPRSSGNLETQRFVLALELAFCVSALDASNELNAPDSPSVPQACCNHVGVQGPVPNISSVQEPHSNRL